MNLRSITCSMIILASSPALGKDHLLSVAPVFPVSHKGSEMKVQFDLPCDATWDGFVLNPHSNGTLTINALMTLKPNGCTGLPKPMTATLPRLDWHRFKKIETLHPHDWMGRPVLVKTKEARIVRSKNRGPFVLEATYQSRCGSPLGFVMQTTDGTTKVAYLELIKKNASNELCDGALKLVRLPNYLSGHSKIDLIPTESIPLEQRYTLHLAHIVRLEKSPNGGVDISYQRRCNEAPVGVLTQPADQSTHLGMVVAHYYNLSCPANGPKVTNDQYHHSFIGTDRMTTLFPINPKTHTKKLQLTRPQRFAYTSHQSPQGIVVETLGSCHQNLGIVSRPNSKGEPRIAVLSEAITTGQPACNLPTKEVSLKIENFFNPAPTKKIRPLILVGAT